MAALSNFFRLRDRDAAAPDYRPVRRHEIEPALRLIIGGSRAAASDEQILDFLSFSLDRGIDVNTAWVADAGGRIEWALLPVQSAGRTMLIFSPVRLPPRPLRHVVGELVERVLAAAEPSGVVLAQVLIEMQERELIDLYLAARFVRLADLAYLQARVRGDEPLPALPAGWAMHTYDTAGHATFAETIARTYVGSLDCPSLNGRREIDDIVAGHKAAGDFDPRLWFLLEERGNPLGTLLISRSHGNAQAELVYVGLVPEARGRGAGDLLIRWGLAVVGLENRRYFSLAVDASNAPALRLYHRHGFARVGARTALLRDLRTAPPAVAPAPAGSADPTAAPPPLA